MLAFAMNGQGIDCGVLIVLASVIQLDCFLSAS